MEAFLQDETNTYQLVVGLDGGQAAEGVPVECAKCGTHLVVVEQPTHKPACPKCWDILRTLKAAAANGFRFGF